MTKTIQTIYGVLEKLEEEQLRLVLDYAQSLTSDDEREVWRRFGQSQFAKAYGDDEPEYTEADVKRARKS